MPNHAMHAVVVAAAVFTSALLGCASGLTYTPIVPYDHAPKAASVIVVVAKGEAPPCKATNIGELRSTAGTSGPGPIDRMREKAAELGADGIVDYSCGDPKNVGQVVCTAHVYVCDAIAQ